MSTFTERLNNLMKNVTNEKSDDTEFKDRMSDAEQAGQNRTGRSKTRLILENMNCDYANFFNISAIKEEVVLSFGVDRNWEHAPQIHDVELNARIILNPLAAKRLSSVLNQLVQEYEKRFQTTEKELLERARLEAERATKH